MSDWQSVITGTGKVTQTIKVNGASLPAHVFIHSCTVLSELNRITRARISFLDGSAAVENFSLSNSDLMVPGNKIEVLAGYDSDEAEIFSGVITKQKLRIRKDGSPVLNIEAAHEAVKMTTARKSRYFYNSTDSEVMKELIDNYGIDSMVDDTSFNHGELVQYQASDWDFMVARAEANGLFCDTSTTELRITKPSLNTDSVLELYYGFSILEFDAEINAQSQQKNTRAFTWDMTNQSLQTQEGDSPESNLDGTLNQKSLSDAIGGEHYDLYHDGNMHDGEAKAWADARKMRNDLAKITGRVQFQGQSNVKPGNIITLRGVGEQFSGKVFVSAVRHTITEGKWLTDAQFGLNNEWFTEKFPVSNQPAAGVLPAINGLHTGLVTQLEGDPQGEERILVRLPIINPDGDGVWARIVFPGAGNESGFFYRPEIGEEVLVGFINDDPRDAVILGGVHSSANPAPVPLTDDNYKKGMVTRSGIKALFEDDKGAFTVKTTDGKKQMSLNNDAGEISLQDEHGNKFTMDANGIELTSNGNIKLNTTSGDINLEGKNVTGKANMNFKAEGKTGAEVNSSGTAQVKGTIVKIN